LARRAKNIAEALPSVLAFLSNRNLGREHGVGFAQKLRLVARIRRNSREVEETLSSWLEHLELAAAILGLPRSADGVVVECGCYRGGSTVNLSLACALAGRRLVVFDSFQGLPEPSETDRVQTNLYDGHTEEYYRGRFAVSTQVVKENLARYGDLSVCELVPGFFEETLPAWGEPVALAFLDVDLVDSLQSCLLGLWPNLIAGGRIYVHEARSLLLVSIFFATPWWRSKLGEDAPGFVGAGTGLPLSALRGSDLGYAQKGTGNAAFQDTDPAEAWQGAQRPAVFDHPG
jgi:Macrocin-O-methyltransferase (TylF)